MWQLTSAVRHMVTRVTLYVTCPSFSYNSPNIEPKNMILGSLESSKLGVCVHLV